MYNLFLKLNLQDKYLILNKIPLCFFDNILSLNTLNKNVILNFNNNNNNLYYFNKLYATYYSKIYVEEKFINYINFNNINWIKFNLKKKINIINKNFLFINFIFKNNIFKITKDLNTSILYYIHFFIKSQFKKRIILANTKTRSKVSGSGRKLWKQKGTGKARRGSIRSPITRSGGISFGPNFRKIYIKINKKFKFYLLFIVLQIKLNNINFVISKNDFINKKSLNIKNLINNNNNNKFYIKFNQIKNILSIFNKI